MKKSDPVDKTDNPKRCDKILTLHLQTGSVGRGRVGGWGGGQRQRRAGGGQEGQPGQDERGRQWVQEDVRHRLHDAIQEDVSLELSLSITQVVQTFLPNQRRDIEDGR